MTFETHLREAVSRAGWSLGVIYVISYLIVHVCSRAVSMHMACPGWNIAPRVDVVGGVLFGLVDSIVRSAERFCEGEHCCLAQKESRRLLFAL